MSTGHWQDDSDERVLLGSIIDGLGVKSSIADDDMVTDVVVISKVVDKDGAVRLNTAWSEGMSWIERLGMVTACVAMETPQQSGVVADDGPA